MNKLGKLAAFFVYFMCLLKFLACFCVCVFVFCFLFEQAGVVKNRVAVGVDLFIALKYIEEHTN